MPLHPDFVARILSKGRLTLSLQSGWGWRRVNTPTSFESIESPKGDILIREIEPLVLSSQVEGFRGRITSGPECVLGKQITCLLHSTMEVDGLLLRTPFYVVISDGMAIMKTEHLSLIGWIPRPTTFPTFEGWAVMAPFKNGREQ